MYEEWIRGRDGLRCFINNNNFASQNIFFQNVLNTFLESGRNCFLDFSHTSFSNCWLISFASLSFFFSAFLFRGGGREGRGVKRLEEKKMHTFKFLLGFPAWIKRYTNTVKPHKNGSNLLFAYANSLKHKQTLSST